MDRKFREHNNNLKKRIDENNSRICDEMVVNYNNNMSLVLEEKRILNENEFKNYEKDLNENTLTLFKREIEKNGFPIDLNIQSKLENCLKESRKRLKQKFQENRETITAKIKAQVQSIVDAYERDINDFLDSSPSLDLWDKKHQNLSNQALNQLITKSGINDESFLVDFKTELNNKIEDIFQCLKKREKEKQNEIQINYKTEAQNIKMLYNQVIFYTFVPDCDHKPFFVRKWKN